MAGNIIDELMGYRVKIEKDGREILNVPGILALPGMLIAPKTSIIGTFAASLLGCSIRLEKEGRHSADVGEKIRKAADTVADTAKTAVLSVREVMDKAWDALSADDPEGCPEGEENGEETGAEASGGASPENTAENTVEEIVEELEKHEANDVPVIRVENPAGPDDKTEA